MTFRTRLALGAAIVALVAATVPGTAVAAPPAPTGLRATGTTGTSVALSWNAVGGADLYEIKRDGVVTGTAEIPSTMQVGLTPSTTYKFRVRAKDGGSTSPDSAEISVTTGSDPGGSGGKIIHAGARSSSYGISPFPNPCGWTKAMSTYAGYHPGSAPTGVWIVGNLSGSGTSLQFPHPGDGRNYGSRIKFAGSDKHERYLDYFDEQGVKVWLQVESGFADMPTLVDLVLNRYKHHPSVLGFGVDVEWFNPRGADLNDPVTDTLAQRWDTKVKSHGARFSLFLKHFDQSSMPPTYRGGIVFVDDSQYFDTIEGFLAEMKAWADRYYPNTVLYQIGYSPDKKWWNKEAKPIPKTMATKLQGVTRQDFGVAWVDFTLRDVLPTTC